MNGLSSVSSITEARCIKCAQSCKKLAVVYKKRVHYLLFYQLICLGSSKRNKNFKRTQTVTIICNKKMDYITIKRETNLRELTYLNITLKCNKLDVFWLGWRQLGSPSIT